MMKYRIISLMILVSGINLLAQDFNQMSDKVKHEGFFDFYYDSNLDKIYLVIEDPGEEFLYVHSLSSGLGHNDIGLDRGQLGGEALVYFRKTGDRMLLVRPNMRYRAISDMQEEKKAVEEAFARSVLYAFKIIDQQDDAYLVDISDMLFSDAHRVSERLTDLKQGSYTLDAEKSGVELSRTRSFPDNTEFDVMLTFSGTPSGNLVSRVTPDPHHLTVNQHHSFVKLPDNTYRPREFHPL